MEWSKILPNSCPPNDAESKSIVVYRFLKSESIEPQHFLTVRELAPNRPFPDLEKECRACSLSVLTDKEEVIRLQKTVPRFRQPAAVGKLQENSGKVKHTPSAGQANSSHHSWWIPTNVNPCDLFNEIIKLPNIAS